jgi:2-dehydropantoate 2-reductase
MKIAIVGAGAVGGFLGALLARAGHDVTLLARGPHLAAIRATGLQVRSSQLGDFTVAVRATDQPTELGRNDLVVVGVKLYDFAAAAQATAVALAPDGVAVTIQNGLDAPFDLAAVVGQQQVLIGTAAIEATLQEPGVVGHLFPTHAVTLSELHGPPTGRVERLADELKAAGINVTVVPDGYQALWDKAARLIPFATLTTAAACGLGALMASPESVGLSARVFDEVTAVALATGHDVSAVVQRIQAQAQTAAERAPRFTSSMNRDMLAGKPIELEWLTGKLIRLADEYSVPVPAHTLLYAVIKARLAERDQAAPPHHHQAPVLSATG